MGNMVGIDPGMAAWNNSLFPSMPIEDFVRYRLEATSLVDEVRRHAPATHFAAGSTLTTDLGEDALADAVSAAAASDVVVLALGGASLWFNGERTEGEASDSGDIALPAAQVRLAEAVAATGKPIVDAAKELDKKMTAIEEALYQTKNRSSQDPLNFPIRLNDKLSSVADSAAGGDFAPTAQARAVYADLVGQIDAQLAQLRALWEKDLPALNELVKKSEVAAVK